MQNIIKLIGIALLLLLITACPEPGTNSGTNSEVRIYVDDVLYTGGAILVVDNKSITVRVETTSDKDPFNFYKGTCLDSSNVTDNSIKLTGDLLSSKHDVYDSYLKINNFNLNYEKEIVVRVFPTPMLSITGSITLEHGEYHEHFFKKSMPLDEFTYTMDSSISKCYQSPNSSSRLRFEGLGVGTTTLTVTINGIDDFTKDFEVTVNPREIVPEMGSGWSNLIFTGNQINTEDCISLSYSDEPKLPIGAPPQEFSITSGDDNILSTSGKTITGVSTGTTELTISPDYNSANSINLPVKIIDIKQNLTINGMVTDGPGSFSVSDSTISLYSRGSTTKIQSKTSGSNSEFSFSGLDSGFYDIVASKEGRAGSRIDNILLTDSDRYIELVQKEVEVGGNLRTTDAPMFDFDFPAYLIITNDYVISAELPDTGVFYSSDERFNLGAYLINGNGDTQMLKATSEESLEYTLEAESLVAGDSYEAAIVCYDNNNNRLEYRLPLEYSANVSGISKKPGDHDYEQIDIQSITVGTEVNSYSAENGSAHSVRIAVEQGDFTTNSIKIYRSTELDQEGIAIGISSELESGENLGVYENFINSSLKWFYFIDDDYRLSAGETYYYRVSYIEEGAEGPLSDPVAITLLPAYNVELDSPANNNSVSETPAFEWQKVEKNPSLWLGLSYDSSDKLIIVAADAGQIIFADEFTSGNQPSAPLNPGTRYEWDVVSIRTIESSLPNTHALSSSMPRSPIYSPLFSAVFNGAPIPLSNNGSFIFYFYQE